jgi:exodeoxyribonuclease V alpha subunit
LHPSAAPTLSRETLVGSVERVTFHSEDSGFAVLKVKARGKRDLVTVVCHATASISAGEFIHAVGVWITDRTHGLQFKADLLKTTPPTTAEGIEKYLGSGMVRGIGQKLAQRIVGRFGVNTFEIIEASQELLRDVSGIGDYRAGKIAAGWAEQKAVRDIMLFLHSHGVGASRAVRIFKTYGHDAIAVMKEDPYRVARDIRGVGFRTADAIAMKLGMSREAPRRVRAGISFALQEATDEGHCALPVGELINLAAKLLEIDLKIVQSAMTRQLAGEEAVGDAIGGDCTRARRRGSSPRPGPRVSVVAGDRRRKGDPLGREEDRQDARRLAARGDRDGPALEGLGG